MNKKNIGIIAAIFVAMLLTSAPFALAAPSSKLTGFQTLDKDVLSLGVSAGILPDSPIYGIKRFWEGMQVTFAGGDVAKAKLKYRFAEKRLAEAAEMLKSGKLKDEGLREDLIVKAKQRLNISDTIKVTIGETESKVAADVADINKRFTLDLIDQTAIVSEIASRLNITSELVNGLVEWKYAKTSEETKDNLEEARDDVAALEQKISEMNSKATAAKKKVTAAFKKSIGKSVDVAKDHIAKGERYLLDKKYDSAWSQANSASKGADAADKRVDKYLAKLLKDLSTEEEEQDEETTTTTAPASTTTTVAASTTTTA